MNQCVPSWDLDENPAIPALNDEVAELTWKNGQLAMHGLGPPRAGGKPGRIASSPTNWDKPRAGGTLEAIVNQATRLPHHKLGGVDCGVDELVPWFDHRRAMVNPAASTSVAVTMDALVPCNNRKAAAAAADARRNDNAVPSAPVLESGTCAVGCSTRVGSCSGVAVTLDGAIREPRMPRFGVNSCDTNGSASESATCGGSYKVSVDAADKDLAAAGFTSPSTDSPVDTSSGKEFTLSIGDDHDSVCYSRRQRERYEEDGKKRGSGKSSILTKRSRAAAIHNQSERKRRDRINQRMKTLQRLVPNSSKTDKASMLDEVIEYIKQLQAHVQIMRMSASPMMMPLAAMQQQQQQQLQMAMMAAPLGMGMGLMDMNALARSAPGMVPPAHLANPFMPPMGSLWDNPSDRLSAPAPVMPADPLAAYLAWQSQMMTMDAYSRLATMYQQFQQQPNSTSKN